MDKFDYADYEATFKNQPLYKNQFNLSPAEIDRYRQQAPEWVKKWQQELDKIYAGG